MMENDPTEWRITANTASERAQSELINMIHKLHSFSTNIAQSLFSGYDRLNEDEWTWRKTQTTPGTFKTSNFIDHGVKRQYLWVLNSCTESFVFYKLRVLWTRS